MKKITLLLIVLWLVPQAFAQIVPVGSGSYTTQLPPADAAGRNHYPIGTPKVSGVAATKPIATSDWWTGLLTDNGANLYNYPFSLKGIESGLVVSYTFLGDGVNDTRQPMGPEQPIIVGVTGAGGAFPTVSNYSDWTVTASWSNAGHTFDATMGMGMPFVYCTKGAADVASVTVNTGTVSIQSEMLLITNSISGANFAVYAPAGSSWTQSGVVYTSTLAGKNYFSIAMLPRDVVAATAASDYKQYAYVFPTNTNVSWVYDNATSIVKTTFTVTADKKEGTGTSVLLGLLPHQWAHLGATSAQPGAYFYNTSRGKMKMLASNTFVVENTFKGILPTLPNTAKYSAGFDPGALNAKIDQVKGAGLDSWTDSYNDGLAMNRLVQAAKIADQIGNTQARDQLVQTVKTRLEDWFKAESGENAFVFYYNSLWTTLIGYPSGYSSDEHLNDHHFHYGYFISAAAAIEQLEPGWASQWGNMVNLLIKDAANWDKTDTKYPFLRNFNPYAGHSFANGMVIGEPHGNNQESSSEAMNFNASLINWGELTGNTAIRDLGIYLYTTEQTGIEEYWFDVNQRNFATNYKSAHSMCSRVWGNGYDAGTFWTSDIAAMYGIEMFPITGASLYLGHNKAYSQKVWNEIKAKTTVLTKPNTNANLWLDIYWSYLAMTDPATALTLYNDYPNYPIKGGCSDAQTYHWLHSLNGAGQMDASITADYPIAVVFNNAGNKTYVAHNYGANQITVKYSDGFSMAVPPRTMKTSKDVNVTATLTASASQVPANGSVTLSVATTGTGITKVEFYNGATLVATSTTSPYSATASNLPAKMHGFYAKIYVGTSIQLSNVVSVMSGSQLPYGGTALAIPSQVLEAGNYDTYEGGIGQDIAYFDANAVNEAGSFRSPEYVDAGPTTGEGNTVGWVESGEWLEYTVNIAQAGTYDLNIRYTSGNANGGGPFHIEVDGITVAADIKVNFTNSNWDLWASKAVTGVILPAGQHVMRLAFDKGGFNIGKISFTYKGAGVPVLSVSSPTLTVGFMANSTKTFDITSNIAWTATSNQSWLTVSKKDGFGNETLTLTAQENTTTTTRTATVKVSGAGVNDQNITVTQETGGVSYLITSVNTLTIGQAANSTKTFDITSNVAWTATSNQTWLTLSSQSGTGSANIKLTAEANTVTSSRTATVTVTGTGIAAKTITVTQEPAPSPITLPLTFETGTYTFTDFDGGAVTIIANPHATGINTSTKVGQMIKSAGQVWGGSWIALDAPIDFSASKMFTMKVYSPRVGAKVLLKVENLTDGGINSEKEAVTTTANAWEELSFDFSAINTANSYQKVVLIFDLGTMGDGSANFTFLFDDINLKSNNSSVLSVSANTLTIGSAANSTKTFDITSNIAWMAQSNQTWLTLDKADGTGNATVTLTAQANTGAARTASVTVSGAGVATQTISVTQEAAGGSSAIALPLTFETGTYTFTDFDGGGTTIIANPHATGINTSAKVGQMIKSAGQVWGGSWIALDNPIDFSASKMFTMKVYSPRVGAKVLLKVENLTDGGINAEKEAVTTTANAWEELSFDFSAINTAKSYQKVVLIFDLGTMGDGSANFTFLFDDINLKSNNSSVLTVSATTLTIGSAANSTKTFDITSNIAWMAQSNQAWLTLSKADGTGNATVTLTAQANTGAARTASVTVSGAGVATQTISVTQEAAGGSSAIALPLTFETGTYTFTDFDGGGTTIIANPHATGINTSAKVGQMIKSAGQVWGGSWIALDNPIDFSTNKIFKMKVYSPRVGAKVLLKVENLTDGGINSEKEVVTTTANAWEELSFDFSAINTANSYQKVVLIFDLGTMGDGSANFTFLFDDISNIVNSLSVSATTLTIGASANSQKTFDIKSNTQWTVTSSETWLSVSKSTGSNDETITLTAALNPNTVTRTATVTVTGAGVANQTITVTQEASITAIQTISKNTLSVYPNPASNTLTISNILPNATVSVYNINGELLISTKAQWATQTIDVQNWTNGVYIIKVTDTQSVKTSKIVKQ